MCSIVLHSSIVHVFGHIPIFAMVLRIKPAPLSGDTGLAYENGMNLLINPKRSC